MAAHVLSIVLSTVATARICISNATRPSPVHCATCHAPQIRKFWLRQPASTKPKGCARRAGQDDEHSNRPYQTVQPLAQQMLMDTKEGEVNGGFFNNTLRKNHYKVYWLSPQVHAFLAKGLLACQALYSVAWLSISACSSRRTVGTNLLTRMSLYYKTQPVTDMYSAYLLPRTCTTS